MSGIPFEKGAAINRCLVLYSVLDSELFSVLILNHKTGLEQRFDVEKPKSGSYGKLHYLYTTPTAYKPKTFLKRRYYKFIGRVNELFTLIKLKLNHNIDVLLYYPDGLFFDLIAYRTISKLLGIKLIAHYVEFRSSFERNGITWKRINDLLFDKYFMHFCDGVLPISSFLFEHVKDKKTTIPQLKIPPIIDFDSIAKLKVDKKNENFFLYVGAAGYFSAINTILDAFERIEDSSYYLYLILHGKGLDKVREHIEKHTKSNLIKIFTNLDYSELIAFNLNAKALLIPLEDTIKDTARFPQKISEYIASKRPIITTDVGEIKYYFKDGDNALITSANEPALFSAKMEFVINHPKIAADIGKQAYETGLAYFNTISYKSKLEKFIRNIVTN